MELQGYAHYRPPIDDRSNVLTPKEGRENFAFFLGQIPERLQRFDRLLAENQASFCLDYSRSSMTRLGR